MAVESEADFLALHHEALACFWHRVENRALHWRSQYQWPPRSDGETSIGKRSELHGAIREELEKNQCLSKPTFDGVMRWGFGTDSGRSAEEIAIATRLAFRQLRADQIAEAAWELMKLPKIGISRASKILALSDQDDFGIYDSRSAHGISDLLRSSGQRIVPIPPGRVIAGDNLSNWDSCVAFQKYTWVLRHFRTLSMTNTALKGAFDRVADLEMAFFMRSRIGDTELISL